MTVAVDAEISALMRCLQQERDHVLGAVEGLSDEALRRPVLGSPSQRMAGGSRAAGRRRT